MSWFSNLSETYERVSMIPGVVGVADSDGNVLLPQNHMLMKTQICITLDGKGVFRGAEKSELRIMIPCTAKSETGRTSAAIAPHPLHEQLKYLAMNEKCNAEYIKLISSWTGLASEISLELMIAHDKIKAVYGYTTSGTILNDLRSAGIKVDIDEYDKQGHKKTMGAIDKERKEIERLFVRFRVEIPGDLTPNLWEDTDVVKAWQGYCEYIQSKDETQYKDVTLCYITGDITPIAERHSRGINTSTDGAKLVGCNDEINYTYRGRFTTAKQANAIGLKASHEAHAMLKFLIATQGFKCDTQAVIAWSIDDGKTQPDPFSNTDDIFGLYENTSDDGQIEIQAELAADYSKKLRNALQSKGDAAALKNISRRVAVLAEDAATTGRMGITFYQELRQDEYIDRIIQWHENCRWWFYNKGYDCDRLSAPSADSIIAAVYGEQKGEGYIKIKKQARERILSYIFNGEALNKAWLNAAVNRVSNPFSFSKTDGGWDYYKWLSTINVTCAIARKYYLDKKEEVSLELEKTRNDRDYLYGRLLAIADKIESHARYLQEKKNTIDKRPTNAVNYLNAFASKPFKTWALIYGMLNPYIQRLEGAEWYQRQIDEIMSLFKDGEYENDKPLSGLYLLGYSLQRRTFSNKNTEEDVENAEQEN